MVGSKDQSKVEQLAIVTAIVMAERTAAAKAEQRGYFLAAKKDYK